MELLPRFRVKDYVFYVTQPSDPMYYAMTAVVDGLASDVDITMLKKLGSQCGLVLECQIVNTSVSDKCSLTGEVLFSSSEGAYNFVNESYHSFRFLLKAHLKRPGQKAGRNGYWRAVQSLDRKSERTNNYVYQRSSVQDPEMYDACVCESSNNTSSHDSQRHGESNSKDKPNGRQNHAKSRTMDESTMMQNQPQFPPANTPYMMQNIQPSGIPPTANTPYMMQNQPQFPPTNTPYMMQNQPQFPPTTNSPYMMQNQPQFPPTTNSPYMMQNQITNAGTHFLHQPLCCGTIQQMGGVLQPSDNAILVQNFHTQFRPDLVLGLLRTFGTLAFICFVDEQRT